MLSEANPLDSTVVASKCANVVAGAGSAGIEISARSGSQFVSVKQIVGIPLQTSLR